MQFNIQALLLTLFAFLTLAAAVTQPQKSVLISFPSDTPGYVVDQAKDAIRKAGGVITHEYKIIKGFACTATAKALDMVNALDLKYTPTIEDDQIVSINGGQS